MSILGFLHVGGRGFSGSLRFPPSIRNLTLSRRLWEKVVADDLRPVYLARGLCSPAVKAVSISPVGAAAILGKTSVDSRHGHGFNGRSEWKV